jgi:hypothetical protein
MLQRDSNRETNNNNKKNKSRENTKEKEEERRRITNINKYCGYNTYTNNLVPIKHLKIIENNEMDEDIA